MLPAHTDPTTEIFSAAALQAHLTTHTFGRALHVLASTHSTNEVAKTTAFSGAAEGTVILADHQTHGRGRQGRTFVSPPGVGVYLSLILRPQLGPERLPQLPLLAAVATAEAITARCALSPSLKWPNDVHVQGKKVAGILSEAVLPVGASPYVILGIGINVNTTMTHFPPDLRPQVTSLALAAGHAWARLPLIAELLAQLERLYTLWHHDGIAPIIQRWLDYTCNIGQQAQFTEASGQSTGIVVGLDAEGALLVRDTAGLVHRIIAGEVTFL